MSGAPTRGPLPLAPRWLETEIGKPRAGARTAVKVTVVNDGTATWRSDGADGLQLSYHWLDTRGNPIVWDGIRTALPRAVAPGDTLVLETSVEAPRPPGTYQLAFDFVEEHRFWLQDVGCKPHIVAVDVESGIPERRLQVIVHGGDHPLTTAALAAQDEEIVDTDAVATAHLVGGAEPARDWSRRLLDAHEAGYAAVGSAIVPIGGRLVAPRRRRLLEPWKPGGRNPRFTAPLLLPSLLIGLEPSTHLDLPAYSSEDGLFEGRAQIRLPLRSDRRRD